MSQPSSLTPTCYLDSSALVKRYLTETGTTWVQAWCDDPEQVTAIAEIGLVEMTAAFGGKLRGGFISQEEYRAARADLEADADDKYVLVAIDRSIVDVAIELTARHRLRGYDAVHLACALHLNHILSIYLLPSLYFVSADNDLLTAATAEGLATENPNNYP